MVDSIYVRDLRVGCIIGIEPRERETKQDVVINLALECDLTLAAVSDDIADTVNYKRLKDEIVKFVADSRFFLIEKLADGIASLCLHHERVQAVTVSVDKPGALTGARSVAIEIRRCRD